MKSKLVYFLFVILYSTANGQFGSVGVVDARSMSLAKTYTATTSGIYSVGINPANLSLNNDYLVQFSTVLPVPSISLGTGSNFISINDINYYFGGVNGEPRFLTERDKEELNSLFDGGGAVFASVTTTLFSAGVKPDKKIGAFAFSIYDYAGMRVNIPGALADLALSGNAIGRKFDLSEGDIKGWWIRNFDIGFAATLKEWAFSLALTDVGLIKWDKNAAEFNSFGYLYIDDISNEDQLDSAKESITGDSKKIDHFYTGLSTALRVGVSRMLWEGATKFPGSLLLAFDYNQGLNEMPGNSVQPRFSIGAEWKPMDYFPYLRTGFSLGGGLGFGWAFGLGVDAGLLELHFATSDMQSVVAPNATKTLSVSFGSRWKF